MPNTKSAEKAVRSSAHKYAHNQQWKKKVKDATRNLSNLLQKKDQNADILNKELSLVAKTLDKAAKEKVIHKNKANRLKSRYARKITAYFEKSSDKASTASATTEKGTKGRTAKSKS